MICQRKGCTETEGLAWPTFLFYALGRDRSTHSPLRAEVRELTLCPKHQEDGRADLMPSILAAAREAAKRTGKAEPDPAGLVEWTFCERAPTAPEAEGVH